MKYDILWICEQILWKKINFEFPKQFSETWTFLEFVNNFWKHERFLNIENKFGTSNYFLKHEHFFNLEKSRTNLEAQIIFEYVNKNWNPVHFLNFKSFELFWVRRTILHLRTFFQKLNIFWKHEQNIKFSIFYKREEKKRK